MTISDIVAAAVVLIACGTDLHSRRIPNLLTMGAAVAGFAFGFMTSGTSGLVQGGGGWLAGFVLYLPLFLLGGMGAGDVKLLAALGAWLGPQRVLWVALYGAIAGGVLAIATAMCTGYMRTMFCNMRLLLTHWRVNGIRPLDSLTLESGHGPRLAYAVPIAVGVLCAQWLR
jgi:prepilin peptidase CpaA